MYKTIPKYFILVYSIFFINTGIYAQKDLVNINYFGVTAPNNKPKLFNPDFISDSSFIQNGFFSSDGKEFYYVETDGNWSYSHIFYVKNINGKYSEPVQLFSELPICLSPFVSYNNDKIVFISSQSDSIISGDVFIAKREGNAWNKPEVMSTPVNSEYDEWEVSLSKNGTIYFSSNRPGGYGEMDIYKSVFINENYNKTENLGRPINTPSLDECAYIAPDESYIIFNSWKQSKHKGNNLYISFNNNGKWTNPKGLGDNINTDQLDIYPHVSPDGKYIFFTIREKPFNCVEPSKLYWVSSSIIDSLRNTNFTPYVNEEIPDTSFQIGYKILYQIPPRTFVDDDKNDGLKYSITLANGEELPNWLEFCPKSLQLTGTPEKEEILNIMIKVFDDNLAEANLTFKIEINKRNKF